MCSANKNISLKNDNDESDKEFIRKSKLYTKTGDKGCTGLYSGERRKKTEPIFHTLGAIDELNCELGICKVHYYNIMKCHVSPATVSLVNLGATSTKETTLLFCSCRVFPQCTWIHDHFWKTGKTC